MGTLISKLALKDGEINVVGACDVEKIGKKLGDIVSENDPNDIIISNTHELDDLINDTSPDIAIDFTIAEATEKNCLICVRHGIRCVIGTTGLSNEFLNQFKALVLEKKTPAVISSNMATGVNVFFKMLSLLSKHLEDWDIEIIETHHHRKRDSPSGTALTAAKIVCDTIGCELSDVVKYGRERGPNKREIGAKNEIGIHSIRAGDIVGDHTVLYAGSGERIEFKHQAHNRNCFATGAIKAIKFLANAKENKIYTTQEVLGL
jgi:4-hydroxy-tetrahydrodipicolinate reductase